MIFTVDIGNSYVKIGCWRNNSLLEVSQLKALNFSMAFKRWINTLSIQSSHIPIVWMNVGKEFPLEELPIWQEVPFSVSFFRLSPETELPIKNCYATPNTLGIDRIIAVVGAKTITKSNALLVIDAGTALTYDYATARGEYKGGGIAPGLYMRFQALHQLTAKLPLVRREEEFPLIGNTTALSIRSGVINGIISEIEGIISKYKQMISPEISFFLTGGDAPFLEKYIKNVNFVDLNLIHKGMYATYIHNNSS